MGLGCPKFTRGRGHDRFGQTQKEFIMAGDLLSSAGFGFRRKNNSNESVKYEI